MQETVVEAPAAGRKQYARSEETRARILDAALAEASRSGFQNTSVAKIAARAGVAIGNLNYHFGSKQALLRGLMSAQVEALVSRLAPPEADDDFFAYEQLMLRTYLEFLRANPAYVRLAEEVRVHDPDLYRDGTRAHIEHLVERIAAGIERRDLRPMSRDEIRTQAYLMLGSYTFLDRFLEDPDYPGDDVVTRTCIAGLRATLAA